ncbi:hypothetical protein BJ912DRAFT_135547, partial [Pholiota molesta]
QIAESTRNGTASITIAIKLWTTNTNTNDSKYQLCLSTPSKPRLPNPISAPPGGRASVHAALLSLRPVLEPVALHLIDRAIHLRLVGGAREAVPVAAAHRADPPVPAPAPHVAHGARAPRAAPPAVVAVQAAPVPAVHPARRLQRALRRLGELLRGRRGHVGGVGGVEGTGAVFVAAVAVVVEGAAALHVHVHAAGAGELGVFVAERGRGEGAGGGDDEEGGDELGEMHISTIDLEIERGQYLLGAMAEDAFKWKNLTERIVLC